MILTKDHSNFQEVT